MSKQNHFPALNETSTKDQKPKSDKKQKFDVIVFGGGPVGLLAAYMLTGKNFHVALIDRLDYEDVLTPDFDGRTFAYAHGSQKILDEIGLWDDLSPHATPIHDIYVTADYKEFCPTKGLHYDASKIEFFSEFEHAQNAEKPSENFTSNKSSMGYNIETRYFRKFIFSHLQKSSQFTLFAPKQLSNISFDSSKSVIDLNSGESLEAPLIIGCDGKNSFLREKAGIAAKKISYNQKALVGLIRHKKPHNNCAYEHFLPCGPLALLPMQDDTSKNHPSGSHRCGFIWSLSTDRADHFHSLSDQNLSPEIETYFKDIIGPISVYGNRWLFPLEATLVKSYVNPRLVLVGDAAHSIHPVAGQGFNLGIRDVYALTSHLSQQRDLGLDYGTITNLMPYQKSRRLDVLSMTSMCHGLVRLFSNESRSLDHMRKIGLSLTNGIPSLKTRLTKHAMGI